MIQHGPHIAGQILKIPFIDQSVDLPRFFTGRVLCIHMVQHSDKPHAPLRKKAMQVFFHQLHITGKARLRFGQDHLKPSLLRVRQHGIEPRPRPVDAGIVLVGVNAIDTVAVLLGPAQQQFPLVADALGLRRGLFLVLLAQAAVYRRPPLTRGH